MIRRSAIAVAALGLLVTSSHAESWKVQPQASLFAVVTHKGGFAGGLAHNHLVAADGYEATLELDAATPEAARFELGVPVESLIVDRPELQREAFPRLQALGILDEEFTALDDGKRDKIRRTMLSPKQLAAERYPRISAAVVDVRAEATDAEFPYRATLALTVRETRVEREVRARYEQTASGLTVEAWGTFRFTDFGIEPYSMLLGAVKNQDEFHVYVRLIARLAGVAGDAGPSED